MGRGLLASLPGRLTGEVPVGRVGAGVGLDEVGLAGADGAAVPEAFGADGAGAAAGLGRGVGADGFGADGAAAEGAPADGVGAAGVGALCRLTGFWGAV